jgi:hypothetical protein
MSDNAPLQVENVSARTIPHLMAATAPAICLALVLTPVFVAVARLQATVEPGVRDLLNQVNGLSLLWLAAGALMGLAALLANWVLEWRPGVIHNHVRDGRLRGPLAESSKNAAEYEHWEERAETVARRTSEKSRVTWSGIARTFTTWGIVTACLGSVFAVISWLLAG